MIKDYAEETYPSAGLRMGFKISRTLFSGKSPFQMVEVVETQHHGRMLFNDGCAMLSERDEFIYHDMLAHVPLFLHPNPERVLIIGGGDGGTAREVLRHQSIESVVMVEIDEMVVSACREFIPKTAAALSDPRLSLLIQDGVEYVKQTRDKFDVVLVDSTDPIGPAQPLFGVDFYRNVKKCLNPGGVVVAQGETPFYALPAQASLLKVMGTCFEVVRPYNFTNMTYPGGLWSFAYASDVLKPVTHFDPTRPMKSGLEFGYYTAQVHQASFALPAFMERELKSEIKGSL